MISPTLRSRLSRIARGAAPATGAAASTVPALSPPARCGKPFAIAYDAEHDGCAAATAAGAVWLIDVPLPAVVDDYEGRWQQLAPHAPDGGLFIDIETAGLAGAPLFLIGALSLDERGLKLAQWLARDYTEEAASLAGFAASAARAARWVSFNGSAFDVPYLLDRGGFHGVTPALPREHVDLLHAARRRWRSQTGNCRLQTLERLILERDRLADVPGDAVPRLYHEYVRTGNWSIIQPVLQHNAMDLLTLAELWARLRE